MVEAFPLYWPEGWKRTERWKRTVSRFGGTFAATRDSLMSEVRRLGGKSITLSTNIALRNDGLPYANTREPDDPGVAIYFEYKTKPMCFACDRYMKVQENLAAIKKTIEALRGIERWGASDMMERAFSGFKALSSQSERSWWVVLGVSKVSSREIIEQAYHRLARERHPDTGGSHAAMSELNQARTQAYAEVRT